ncbi:metalloregulator ArsR/SmtB family transcription factor [Microbacterium sp. NPDC028030]|uniref:ArsR/SmtB family transcription factor n=1 Tax=Microbacterium sp. NPDC028030 TaxID=3155124 RepID=UPI0033FF121A
MDIFAAIADPIRRDLLRRLAAGPARVVDLAAHHDVSRPAVSKHLRILTESGLVHGEDRGRERHYAIDTAPLSTLTAFLDELTVVRAPVTPHHLDALDTEVHRTARDRRRAAQSSASPSAPTSEEQSA